MIEMNTSLIAHGTLPDPWWQSPVREYPPVSALVADVVAACPDETMLEHGDRRWSFAEFGARAEELADALRAVGQQPHDIVAIITTGRSFDLCAALLAAWQARAVPTIVDTAFAVEDRRRMLSQARPRTVIALGEHAREIAAHDLPSVTVVVLEADASPRFLDCRRGSETDGQAPKPNDPAYLFFTSGSTGTPKAYVGRHNGLSHMLLWQRQTFGVGSHDRCAHVISLSADACLRDIFMPVISGARLCLPTSTGAVGHEASLPLDWMADARITLAHSVPTTALVWLAHGGDFAALESLRLLFFSGEALSGHLARRLRVIAPNVEFVNLYGVSECTMFQTFHRLPEVEPGIQPVGRGVSGAQALVLSPTREQCAVEEPGEIYLRTPYATLGYLGVDHENAFVPDPFNDDTTIGMFRTGDEGRYRIDGVLAVHGRLRHRPRHGFPAIAAEQVSAVLDEHPSVHVSAVLVTESDDVNAGYIAYIVPEADATLVVDELLMFAARRLPPDVVPTAIHTVDRLPLTATGKLDRSCLRAGAYRSSATATT